MVETLVKDFVVDRHEARLALPELGNGMRMGFGKDGGGSIYSSAANAYFAAMAVQEPANVKAAINAFITGCQADGSWYVLDRMILALGTEQASLLDVKQPTKTAINTNGCVFTPYRGFLGDAISKYIDFGELLTAAGNNYSQNAAMRFAYCNVQGSAAIVGAHVSNVVGTTTRIIFAATTLQANARVNSGTTMSHNAGTRLGNRLITRNDAVNERFYVNGANALGDVAGASTGPSASNATALRDVSTYSDDQLPACGYGGALSDAPAISFQGRLLTLLTALGAN